MFRFFSTSARAFVKFLGFDRNKLPFPFKRNLNKAVKKGGKAEKVVGTVQKAIIFSRKGNPVHQSHFNPADKELIIRVKIVGSRGSKTFHIYENGKATSSKTDK